jgi:hypothetical protein
LRFRAAAEVRNIPTERTPVAMLGPGVRRARVRSAFFYREDVLTPCQGKAVSRATGCLLASRR